MAKMKQVFHVISAVAVFTVTASLLCIAQAAEQAGFDSRELLARYHTLRPKLEKSPFGIPIDVTSHEERSSLRVVVYGILKYPFESVSAALAAPDNWCKITLLQLNIKSCVNGRSNGEPLLTLYSGHKEYQAPDDAYQFDFRFKTQAEQPGYLNILMEADKGPLFTKNHRITLEAVPLDEGSTFIRFGYAYGFGAIARLAVKTYFSTWARDKVGFSVIARDEAGSPQYVEGVRGAIERNAVRYYLALQAYMDSLQLPGSQQFEYRISRWYDLTAMFPRQLYEMDKEEYMATKRREHANQLMLQHEAR